MWATHHARKLDVGPVRDRAIVLCEAAEAVAAEHLSEWQAGLDAKIAAEPPAPQREVASPASPGISSAPSGKAPGQRAVMTAKEATEHHRHGTRELAMMDRARNAEEARPLPRDGDTVIFRGNMSHGPTGRIRWRVVDCDCGLCSSGRFVAVDEPGIDGGQRHVSRVAVSRPGDVDRDAVDAWAEYLGVRVGMAIALAEESSHKTVGVVSRSLYEFATTHVLGELDSFEDARQYEPTRHRPLCALLQSVMDAPHVVSSYFLGRAAMAHDDDALVRRWAKAIFVAHWPPESWGRADEYAGAIVEQRGSAVHLAQ